MNKNLKSLRNLAVGLVLVTLCIVVQESESAVSSQPTIYFHTLVDVFRMKSRKFKQLKQRQVASNGPDSKPTRVLLAKVYK